MKYMPFIILILLPFISTGQRNLLNNNSGDPQVVPCSFDNIAEKSQNQSKESLNALRAYVEKKEDEQREVLQRINEVENDRAMNIIDTAIAKQYLYKVDSLKGNIEIDETIKQCLVDFGYMPEFYGNRKITDLTVITERVRKKVRAVKTDDKLLTALYQSRDNIDKDLTKAKERIDRFYGELYDEGKFRLWITCIFSCCVGALLLFFFIFISRNSESNIVKDFLSTGNGLQFITLFCLIIAIILFGVLGVLEGRELAAILSGISGYILGKGINNPKPVQVKNNADAAHSASTHAHEKKGDDDQPGLSAIN